MAELVVISSSTVRPKNPNKSRDVKIHLTPWDFTFLRDVYTQRGLVFPKPEPKPEFDFISRLKASLSVALEIFYPYAGRLVKVDNGDGTVSFYVDCDNSDGVKFVHAVAENVSVADVLEANYGPFPDDVKYLFPANGMKSYQAVSEPFLVVQVTELKDGVLFATAMNHLLADGSSGMHFFDTWSEISSSDLGFDHWKKLPPLRLKGWFLDGVECPIRIPLSETNFPCDDASSKDQSLASPILKKNVFHFSKENILKLKAKANEEVGTKPGYGDWKISSFQAILGQLWWSIIKHGGFKREQDVHCKLAFNLRPRLNPPLEEECFGNLIGFATATTTAGELLDHGPAWAARLIKETVGSLTNENIRKYAETWVKNIKIQDLEGGISGEACNSLLVVGSNRFNQYNHDYGLGKPVAVLARQGNALNGEILLFSGDEEGSVDAHIWLSSFLRVKLSADVEFMQNVSIL